MRYSIVLALVILFTAPVRAESPRVIMEGILEDLRTLWVPLNLDSDASYDSRRQWTEELIALRFDFPHMARSSLGTRWNRLSEDERTRYQPLFREALTETVIDWLDSYENQIFEIRSVRDSGRNTQIITRFVQNNGVAVNITWVTREVAGVYLFRDVRLAGLSLVADFRGKYNRVIEDKGFETFLEILAENTSDMRAKQS